MPTFSKVRARAPLALLALSLSLAGALTSASAAEDPPDETPDGASGTDGLETTSVTTTSTGPEAVSYGEGVIAPQKDAAVIKALGEDLFGESINGSTGGLSFSQVDLALPGNGPAVEVRRSLGIDGNKSPSHAADENLWRGFAFGEWELDIPYLAGVYAAQSGWVVDTSQPNARCSSPTTYEAYRPGIQNVDGVYFYGINVWSGLQLNVPGSGEQPVLYRAANSPVSPPAGTWTALTTSSQWHFGCLSTVKSGEPGEGFLALAPDGTRYWFDWMVDYAERPLRGSTQSWSGDSGAIRPIMRRATLERRAYRLYPTRVEDRFGNYVTYTWSGDRLTGIAGSDGRSIQLTYNATGQVASVSGSGRTTTYAYSDGLLSTVTRPDNSQWQYATASIVGLGRFVALGDANPFDEPYSCQLMRRLTGTQADLTMTHPSGAQAVYRMGYNRLHRTNLAGSAGMCDAVMAEDGTPITWMDHQPHVPTRFDVLGLQRKTVTGAALATQVWQFAWQDLFDVHANGHPINGTRTVTTTAPDGSTVVEVYGTDALANEGQLLSREVREGATVLTRVDNTYVQTAEMASMPFPDWMGEPLQYEFIRGRPAYNRPLKQSVTTQQGTTFTRLVEQFDVRVRPVAVTRQSQGKSRTEFVEYEDNATKWVLGQEEKRTCIDSVPASTICDGEDDSVMAQTTYDGTYALPLKSWGHGGSVKGRLLQTRTYDTAATVASGQRGTLKSVSDGRDSSAFNTTVTLTSWHRGVPRTIQYPATPDQTGGATQTAVVNDDGTLASVTDENGFTTGYSYDALGRLDLVDYPNGDPVAWNSTLRTFSFVAGAYGLPSHWRLFERTGYGYRLTHYDALWRPVVEETYVYGNAPSTRSVVVKRYDAAGRLAFQSYPMRTLTDWTSTALAGVHTTYDALGRVKTVTQDSELGDLVTTTAYLTGFQTRVTDPRGKITTTTDYLAWDEPILDFPLAIAHPESVGTGIARDVYGKPLAISRAGGGKTVTRSYAYDDRQDLCRQVEPETGATLMGYDAAGNLAWSASGLPASTACSTTGTETVIAARKAARNYDARGRLTSLDFPRGNGDQAWSYTPDGRPSQVVTWNDDGSSWTTNAYAYNQRRMLTGESQAENDRTYTWAMGYGYDVNGHLATLSYPANLIVDFAPNALGQATKATSATQTFASNATYHPNGALAQFTYGNGIVHTLTQNVRGLPDRSLDAYGTTKFLDDGYDFDENGNVAAISDGATGTAMRGNRTMTYDGLDRLKTVHSPMWGGNVTPASYTYDALDNLTRVTVPVAGIYQARDHHYCYDAANQLVTVRVVSCTGTPILTVDYDEQGNLDLWNTTDYVFDFGNRLRSAAGESYRYDAHGRRLRIANPASGNLYHLYGSDGQLFWTRDERDQQRRQFVYLAGSLVAEHTRPIGSDTETVTYQHTDALGSPAVRTSQARAILDRLEYEPYGKRIDAANDDLPGYTGHVMDATTGLTYMQQRYYDPRVGRFWSVDPVTAYSDPVGQFNRYRYANNNPYKFTDPDGRQAHGPNGTWDRPDNSGMVDAHEQGRQNMLESLPVVGDGLAISKAIDKPTAGNILAAAVGLFGAVGDSAAPSVRQAVESKALLGRNPTTNSRGSMTGLSGDRATAKSIFRHETKGQNIETSVLTHRDGTAKGIMRSSEDGTTIRMNFDGTTRIEMPDRKEVLHIPEKVR